MGSNLIIGIVMAIIVIAAIIYGVGFYMRKKNQDKLKALEDRKKALLDLPINDEIEEIRKKHLVGQSQSSFKEWEEKWEKISTEKFAELESQIFEVENLNEAFRFVKAQTAIAKAQATMDNMEAEIQKIRDGFKELRESEERNSEKIQQALNVYEEMKKALRERGDQFGPAFAEIQKQIKNVESEFTSFITLNTSGDPVEAHDVLETAEKNTFVLEELMRKIPDEYESLQKTFPEQLEEITEGYQTLMEQGYVLPVENFAENIQHVNHRVQNTLDDLEKVEITTVEEANVETAQQIDQLYEVMEREIAAKRYVTQNRKALADAIVHATNNNRQLLIELDHTSQSYTLNHNELARARSFQSEIEEIARRNDSVDPKLEAEEIPYSEVESFYKDAYKILDSVESEQVEIDQSLRDLRKDEKAAQEKAEDLEFRLRNLKRFVEKQRLPGLPSDYLDSFYNVTDRIEELDDTLNRTRVDIDEVNQMVTICEEDLSILTEKTHDMIDEAALTEQMMQYANRYRYSHTEVRTAIERALDLFNYEYRYKDALDEIGNALERVEPGVFKQIEDFYYENRESLVQ
ncbi:septation ring formation regulator EzrA [Tetragenococcus osmophilus]|uniref:Septation ring formation regulator EzrA n=1 Tax=Tetragenococcus osmophilus TaxID=526944 RepID=A0AA38CX05_9ENTE|nr:septation ring formation regulator EzrA [Tetragenococcus osmophilus]AYW47119.1 septation ring formation regulator EzrA [Tetragenococcus osmophilus]GMA55198.1 septation ring formation regulator EzrA [Alicyclobacillus contaminans]GMA71034.1 septation ring formation regulator EzrA [Tetragenococcus osmophilus]